MTPARVAVVIPSYNRRTYLEEALESVRSQSAPVFEICVVDDGSTDDTSSYLEAQDDVAVLRVAHCGNPARLRNLGIERTSAPYIAFLDSDDRWHPDKVEKQLSKLEARSDARFCYCGVRMIDARGNPLDAESFGCFTAYSGNILAPLLTHDASLACPTVMVERSLLEEVGGFDERFELSEDYELWIRLAERARAVAIEEPLADVRLHESNNSWGEPKVNEAFIAVYESFLERCQSSRLRALALRQCAHYHTFIAERALAEGANEVALRALGQALRAAPGDPRAWRAGVRGIRRKLMS